MSKKYCKKWQVDNFTTRWGAPSEGLSGRTSKGSVGGGKGAGKRSESRGQETAGGREQRAEVRIGQKTEQPEEPSALSERSYRAGERDAGGPV